MDKRTDRKMEALQGDMSEQTGAGGAPRRRRSPLARPAIIAVILVGLYYTVSRSSPSFEDWEVSYDDALAKATSSNRSILAAFYMDGCPPCALMDRFVLNRRKVKRALQDFVPLRVDAVAQQELSVRYQVQGTPTFLVTSPAGEVLARCEGYQSVDDFISFLSRGREARAKP